MSRKYKFHDKEGLYFVSFATVYWLDVYELDIVHGDNLTVYFDRDITLDIGIYKN